MSIYFSEEIDGEECETSLEDIDTLQQVIYQLVEIYEQSPYYKEQIQDAFAAFGIKITKAPL